MNPTEKMNETRVEEIRKAWATETPRPTHYEHCYRAHAHCAIFALLEVVEFYRERVAEMERIIAKLPKTADGVIVMRGMTVFCPHGHEDVYDGSFNEQIYCMKGLCYDSGCQSDSSSGTHHNLSKCYSTASAALARQGRGE